MRVIVNNIQYKRLIEQQNKENQPIDGWGRYLKDSIIKNLESRVLKENVISLNKLNLKLVNKKFFNELPINNVIINIYEETEKLFNVEWDKESIYLDKNNQIKDVIINVSLNEENKIVSTINENKINLKFIKIKEWYENNSK